MNAVQVFRRRAEDGSVERLGRVLVRVPGGPAEIEAASDELREGLEFLLGMGIADAHGAWLRPEYGAAYVAALPDYYSGSRLWAEPDGFDDEGRAG